MELEQSISYDYLFDFHAHGFTVPVKCRVNFTDVRHLGLSVDREHPSPLFYAITMPYWRENRIIVTFPKHTWNGKKSAVLYTYNDPPHNIIGMRTLLDKATYEVVVPTFQESTELTARGVIL